MAMRRVLGEEHPDTLITTVHLAATWVSLGDMSQAGRLVAPAAASARKVWGNEHPDTKMLAEFIEALES